MGVSTASRAERGITVDQTNESVVVGDEVLVKWQLHPRTGPQPAEERLSALAEFPHTPRSLGFARVESPAGSLLIAGAVAFLPGSEDGWDWAVSDVRALARGATAGEPTGAGALGGIVAQMHLALAADATTTASVGDAASWLAQARSDAAATAETRALLSRLDPLLEPLGGCAGTPVIPIHGDLHIGQVLRTPDGRLWIIDFDGSPLLDPADRLLPQPAARDVATMLASLDHVGRVVVHRTPDLDEQGRARVLDWIREARSEFLGAYRSVLDAAGAGALLDERLLLPLLVQQECREYAYAERYLPHWRYVPDAALPALLVDHPVP
jgi:maltokinase